MVDHVPLEIAFAGRIWNSRETGVMIGLKAEEQLPEESSGTCFLATSAQKGSGFTLTDNLIWHSK
jgi:hypothetical protein